MRYFPIHRDRKIEIGRHINLYIYLFEHITGETKCAEANFRLDQGIPQRSLEA